MDDISIQISMNGQKEYATAVKKYGREFADAVVAQELQLFADQLDSFEEFANNNMTLAE